MKAPITKPVNDAQRAFNELCEKGGGVRGGPARGKVLALLKETGQSLNKLAMSEMADQLAAFPEANPWHVCFAVGLSWGHLARLDLEFTEAVCNVLSDWNTADLKKAASFHMERGPTPIEQSLKGAYNLFGRVTLPATLPDSLEKLGRAQERWLSPILNPKDRPPYIGAWNATAMFMTALFAQPSLAASQKSPPPMLPPGGPIFAGLSLLHRAGILSRPPAGSDLDDASFEPGALYENNGLFAELCNQLSDWCLIDVHSGVYMLGTRHPHSGSWV
ncbi:MAG: hypothetical protein D6801_00195 [Alphaproteobacteria bacterium]|nr:MAG: hypothetical protein D6801_00195 [Alphaproteobacteria bacterium]